MSKPEIILIGDGGHCKSCIDVIEHKNKYTISGIIDVQDKLGEKVLGYPIHWCADEIETITEKFDNFLITLGQLYDVSLRIKLFDKIKTIGKNFLLIISPNYFVSEHASIEEGTIVMNRAILNASSIKGKNCIINTNAPIEHDVSIEDHCHISTSSIINGETKIGSSVFIGSKTVVIQDIEVANNTFIGARSVGIKNLPSGNYFGNPAKPY